MSDTSRAPDTPSLVVRFLKDADAACPVCGYRLRGATAERCSECGTPLHLEIGGPSAGRFLWLASVFGCAIGAGLTALALLDLMKLVFVLLGDPRRIALVQAGMMSRSELPHWETLTVTAVLLTVLSALLAYLIAARRSVARRSRFARITLWVIGALAPLWVLGMLRMIVFWSA